MMMLRRVLIIALCVFTFIDASWTQLNIDDDGEGSSILSQAQQMQSRRRQFTDANAMIIKSAHYQRQLKLLPKLIPSRRQWDCNYKMKNCCKNSCKNALCDGYCGETSVQESLLYYGAYVSQGLIRRVVSFNDYDGAREILIDTDRPNLKPDLVETAELLGLKGEGWYAPVTGKKGVAQFISWTKDHLGLDRPVAMGVIFEDSYEIAYDHIVTAVERIENGLRFNDHYSKATESVIAASLPPSGSPCQYEYCFAKYMNGAALLPPPNVNKDRLVRLKVSIDPFIEPNWSCASILPKNMTLEARAAYPEMLNVNETWYVAVVFRGNTTKDLRDGVLFGGFPVECYALSEPAGVVSINVPSNEAIYTRIVYGLEGCPS
jgi:hypothetical protein